MAVTFVDDPTITLVDDATRSAPTAGRPASRSRDGFLDALRAIAIVRVVVWHALGTPIISWVIATMPIMFFVAGSLLAGSLDARPVAAVMRSRLKRLLVPFWLFGALVLGFLSLAHLLAPGADSRVAPGQLWAWLVPLANPTASGWEAGWASSPLWYLRAYLWLLLLSPVLLTAWRRFGIRVLPALGAVMMAAQIGADRVSAGPDHVFWIVGDIGIYGCFLVLGFAHADGAFARLRPRDLVEWIVVAVAATFVAWRAFPADDGVVNHSYPALFTTGIAWLAVALLARPFLRRIPDVPVLGSTLYWMTRRAMSIYLWHSPAIVGAYALAAQLDTPADPSLILAITVGLVVVAVCATGWIEDVAGGRPAELWPTPSNSPLTIDDTIGRFVPARRRAGIASLLAGSIGALIAVAAIVPVTAQAAATGDTGSSVDGPGLALPPSPSGRPDPTAGAGESSTDPDAAAARSGGATSFGDSGDLTAVAEAWLESSGIDGVSVAVVSSGGIRATADAGKDATSIPMRVDAVVPVTSVTKSFTAAIVMQLVDEGRLDLDAPIQEIPGAGPIPGGATITVRQLLDHSSGLAPYQEVPGYDAGASLDPLTAVRMSLSTDLQWEPGTRPGYSNSGFLALGLIIESITGRSYGDNVEQRILRPLGLASTSLDATPVAGWVGGAAGGLVSSTTDLATWGTALFAEQNVVSPRALAEMRSIDETLMAGLGLFPVCPCTPAGDGTLAATSIGHNGGSTTVQYSPGDGMVIAATFSESFWLGGFDQADVYEFLAVVRASVTG